jgi:AIR synthase-related protein
MIDDREKLTKLVSHLQNSAAVADKAWIHRAYATAELLAGQIRVGDDCAAIVDGNGYLLFAAEGMLESFVADDPWFAGYSAVMVNLSDVAAMGGSPVAIVDVIWTPGPDQSSAIWSGITAASKAYNVPVVGGHTTWVKTASTHLAAAVLGRAEKLLTSFDAKPGDDLVVTFDLRGDWRGAKPFWNASAGAPPARLQEDLQILPKLASRGLCCAGKDISNGGIVGTLSMLMNCSNVGAELWLDRIPRPSGTELERWLVAFPSYGYLLSVPKENTRQVLALFAARDIAAAVIGTITHTCSLELVLGGERLEFRV